MDRVDCPVYRPSSITMSRSMESFIESIEADCTQYGICKITPPSTWKPCAQGYNGQDKDMLIGRTDQEFTRETMASGFFSGTLTPLRKQTVQEFQQEAEKSTSMRRVTSRGDAQEVLAGIERAYWKGIPGHTIYGADNEGSLFDSNMKEWNPANLNSCLSRGLASDPSGHKLKGVNTPYLYYGRWKATFAWHTEDMELHSLNYLHYGAPKIWYCVSPAHKKTMDAFVAKSLYAQHDRCKDFMRHKTVLIKPEELEAHGIPVQKVVQHPGDFIINFPGAYHSGFNVGFNCAESTNFATKSWIQHGAVADFCRCSPNQQSVRLDMGLFLAQAPNDHVRRLVRTRMAKDQAARGEPVDTISHMHLHGAGESDHDSSNLRQEEVKSKRVRKAGAAQDMVKGKAAAQGTAKGRPAAQGIVKARKAAKATVKGKGVVAKDAGKGKAVTQRGKLKGGGTLQKLVKGVKQLKKALQPSKAQQGKAGKAGTAGKADSKRLAAMLKTAKRAELAPSAAAKLPSPKPAAPSPPKSPHRTLNGFGVPGRLRGRPTGSAKAPAAARDMLMQAVPSDTPEVGQQQTQQLAALFLPQQQHTMLPAHQSPVSPASAEPAEAQLLGKGKRKRSMLEGAAPQDELTLGEAVQAIHQKTVQVVRRWMSGGRRDKRAVEQEQAALPDGHHLTHGQPEQQVQQGTAQQATSNEQDQHTDQAGLMVPVQNLQPPQQAQQMTEGPEASNSGQDSCAQLQQSSGQERNKRRRVGQTTAEAAFTGSLRSQARPSSATLKWHGSRTRSSRTTARAGMAGPYPSSFQQLLSR